MTRRQGTTRRARIAGFSLSELLTVIALMALMILFGGPAMADAYRSYKVRSTADILATDIRALRYAAVTLRASQTMTINNESNVGAPNQYSFTNYKGQPVTRTFDGIFIDSTSAGTVTFSPMGSTGSTSSLVVSVRMTVNGSRGDRYTVSVSPSGTVSAAYSTYTP
jgi:Tfp pilus assembly protein FimT